MSAIIGIYHCDGQPVDRADLQQMLDILAHRGPDDSGIWSDGYVGLGHRMLWTTPESLFEKLPLVLSASNLVITADARIDNREELFAALGLIGESSDSITDSQLILHAYQKWRDRTPEYLLGDFAFAIWNQKEQKLFCARDHFGVKPFYYYYQAGKVFAFGSEIKAILCLQEVPCRLNELGIADYLSPTLEDKSITSYKGILRLPPGQTLTVDCRNLQLRSYWSLEIGDELKLNSDREYADAFLKIFTEAVRCRLRSAFPISSHLSGGLDSSSVACVARNLLQKENGSGLHTFSNIFNDVPECDERPFINNVLEQGGFIPHYVHADRSGPLSEWKHFFQYIDEASIGPSHFVTWGLNRATQQAGIRISLDGFDGDTTVSHGANYFAELVRQGNWTTFIAEANAVSQHFDTSLTALFNEYVITYIEELTQHGKWIDFAKVTNEIGKHFQVSRKQLFIGHGVKPLIRQLLGRCKKSLQNDTSIINPNFAQRVGLDRGIQSQNQLQTSTVSVREDQWRSLTCALFTLTLELVDQSSAAFSIESRHPFMDKRLIEFCLALPPEQKLRQGWSRAVMRRAMDNILPKQIQWRGGKTVMTPNFLRGMLHLDRELVDEVISSNPNSIKEFVDLNSLHKSHHRLVSEGKVKNNDDVIVVWKAVTLSLWLCQTEMKLIKSD